jgi:hypothetical protein
MTYNLNGKNIRIPDAEIDKSMKILGLTKDEAVQMWLEDEGYLENEVVEELTAKAKENKVSREAKSDKPRKVVKRERKPDEEKENLIEILSNCLKDNGFEVNVTNKSKIIEFNVGENHYKLDLIKQRPPKK